MLVIHMLEPTDILEPNDWCRPLQIVSMSGGHSDYYSFQSNYTGTPENNAKWVRAKCVIGKPWFGKPVGEYLEGMRELGLSWEFVRGPIPARHQLDMKGYTDLSKNPLRYEQDEDGACDIPF